MGNIGIGQAISVMHGLHLSFKDVLYPSRWIPS